MAAHRGPCAARARACTPARRRRSRLRASPRNGRSECRLRAAVECVEVDPHAVCLQAHRHKPWEGRAAGVRGREGRQEAVTEGREGGWLGCGSALPAHPCRVCSKESSGAWQGATGRGAGGGAGSRCCGPGQPPLATPTAPCHDHSTMPTHCWQRRPARRRAGLPPGGAALCPAPHPSRASRRWTQGWACLACDSSRCQRLRASEEAAAEVAKVGATQSARGPSRATAAQWGICSTGQAAGRGTLCDPLHAPAGFRASDTQHHAQAQRWAASRHSVSCDHSRPTRRTRYNDVVALRCKALHVVVVASEISLAKGRRRAGERCCVWGHGLESPCSLGAPGLARAQRNRPADVRRG